MSGEDVIGLTRSLLRFETINPPGRERDCARHAGAMLEAAGFDVHYDEFEGARTSIVARIGGRAGERPICFTGHLDVVPLGARQWTREPFSGETDGDRLFGRGSSDMKAGVAAMLVAATRLAPKLERTRGVVLALTADEEAGCTGSARLARSGLLGSAGALVVGEPTSNYPLVGHKGAFKFHAHFRGVSAHGSMPHLGVNAIYKAAKAVSRLAEFDFGTAPHPVMGPPTLNVGTIEGGNVVNAVPDAARIGVDVRTVPGLPHAALADRFRSILGEGAELEVLSDLPPLWTEPDHEWVQRVFEICRPYLETPPEPRSAPYMTDAPNLLQAYDRIPTVVLGPGEAALAHQTDEYCSMERVRQAVAIYEALMRDWCGV